MGQCRLACFAARPWRREAGGLMVCGLRCVAGHIARTSNRDSWSHAVLKGVSSHGGLTGIGSAGFVNNATFSFGATEGAELVTGVPSTTPLPAALPLFATGIGGLGLLGWYRKRRAQAV
jgi:hypothetical protein